MWKMLLNLLIDFLLSLVRDRGIKEKDKIEVVNPAPILVPVNPNLVIPVEKGTIKPLLVEKFLPKSQYVSTETTIKEGILLHHSVGGSWDSTYGYWLQSREKVCTHYIIDRDGTIILCLPLDHFGYHVYINSPGNRKVPKKYRQLGSEYDKKLIGVELANLGPITLKNGIFTDVYMLT